MVGLLQVEIGANPLATTSKIKLRIRTEGTRRHRMKTTTNDLAIRDLNLSQVLRLYVVCGVCAIFHFAFNFDIT